MKKALLIIILLTILILFKIGDHSKKENRILLDKKEEMRGLFISYMELNTYIKDKEIDVAKQNIKKIVKNTQKHKFNTLILQIISHDDTIYESKYFPMSDSILLKDNTYFDVLDYFIKESKKKNIDLYLWINPFRITNPNKEISKDHASYQYKDTTVVKKVGDIYYYNPARKECLTNLKLGLKELIQKYQFTGILFDDYFYPSEDIDRKEYEEYIKNHNKISLEEYHLNTINHFIKEVYKEIKKDNKDILFGISPDGNIENNYHKNYADVKAWCSKKNYIDFIMPQIYYGFYNTNKPFMDTVKEWDNLITNDKIKLYYALAFYKVGMEDVYAKDGANEWIENSDMIKKQIIISRNTNHYQGFSLFRYDNLFNKELYTENTIKELEHLKNTLKK